MFRDYDGGGRIDESNEASMNAHNAWLAGHRHSPDGGQGIQDSLAGGERAKKSLRGGNLQECLQFQGAVDQGQALSKHMPHTVLYISA